MIIYLIRHGHAEDRQNWHRSDIERPLIKKGIARANNAFSRFISLYSPPEVIITSNAVRAFQTAEILNNHCKAQMVVRDCLNPSAAIEDYQSVVDEFSHVAVLAVVGHEPDMSEYASYYLSNNSIELLLKKGSIIHMQDGFLINLIQQKVLLL